jgi:hypothetical protein
MVASGLGRGEHLVRESPEIIIGDYQFTLYLTDRRLLFGHETKRRSFAIDRKDLTDAEFFETETGEPLFVISFRGKKKGKSGDGTAQVIMVFSGQSGLPRTDEAEVLFSYIHAIARQNQRISEGRMKRRRRRENLSPGEQTCLCGNKLYEGTSFCTYCGNKIVLPEKLTRNAFSLFLHGIMKKPLANEDKLIPEEISSVQVPCRICLEPIPENSVFCKYCGKKQAGPKKPDNKSGFSLSRLFRAGNNKG